MKKKCFIADDRIWFMFSANRQDSAVINAIPGSTYHGDRKRWSVPLNKYSIAKAKELGGQIDYEISVPNNVLNFKPPKGLELYPFQNEGVKRILDFNCNALLADEMGVGKTIQVLATLGNMSDLRPALIVVPASLKINWERETNKWLPKENVTIVNGTSSGISYDASIIIINYDIIKYYVELIEDIKIMILDECHMICNPKSQRTKAIRYIGMQIDHIIGISGTPIVNRPAEFFTILNLLNHSMFNNKERFLYEFCNKAKDGKGKGASNTRKLHTILTSTFMIRRLKRDVLKDLPEKQRQVICLPIDNRDEYDYARTDLISYLRETENKHISYYALALVRFEKMKQLAAKGKMKYVFEWINNFLEEKDKLVIGCTHTAIVNELMECYKNIAVKLVGGMSPKKKQKTVDTFQNNKEIKLFIGNIKAAGVGLTLTAASETVTIELPWTPGDCLQFEDRVHRVGQESNVTNYYLVAEDTIEEEIAEIIDGKRKMIDAVMDGKETEEETLIKTLIERYKNL